ncbi:hypothetical protein AK830_g3173 [Neonectria ditissima]|uniref:Protein kinase domain-containing protein n=1 Tax=Neonectria ditissima TaxID=78410 RepID=A0A0N8H818_9HYPO|nr:hypothetical protein AK830_g3173 [Neonectria ditissima]
MGRYSTTEPVHLAVKRRDTARNDLDDIRNFFAVQCAILRGDAEVTLHNASSVSFEMRNKLRRTHGPDKNHTAPEEYKFYYVGDRTLRDDLTDDRVRKVFPNKKFQGFTPEFIKILGAGGFGAATLWRIHFEGGVTRNVVIKISVSDGFDADEERFWHMRYGGSRHTVQLFDLAKYASMTRDTFKYKNPRAPLKYAEGSIFEDKVVNGIILEHMNRGDLVSVLRKASSHLPCFPNRVLWGIWTCLIKGAAAVAFQPTFAEKNQIFEQEMEQAKAENRLGAFFKDLEKEEIAHDVHFDLEESNILIGDDYKHPTQPVFKLHDFGGFSHMMSENWDTWDEEEYWRNRKPTKMTRLTPEQIHQDWDELSINVPREEGTGRFSGDNLTQGNPIAGRFGAWTNIFIIAKTMEAVMTFLYVAHPFTSKPYTTLDGTTQAKTYGWRLNKPKYANIDLELRDIVCQCLFERPIDRPGIVSLLRAINRRHQRGFEETGEDVKKFWHDFFSPEAAMPVPQQDNDRNVGRAVKFGLRERLAAFKKRRDVQGIRKDAQPGRAFGQAIGQAMRRVVRGQPQRDPQAAQPTPQTPEAQFIVSDSPDRARPREFRGDRLQNWMEDNRRVAGIPAQGLPGSETAANPARQRHRDAPHQAPAALQNLPPGAGHQAPRLRNAPLNPANLQPPKFDASNAPNRQPPPAPRPQPRVFPWDAQYRPQTQTNANRGQHHQPPATQIPRPATQQQGRGGAPLNPAHGQRQQGDDTGGDVDESSIGGFLRVGTVRPDKPKSKRKHTTAEEVPLDGDEDRNPRKHRRKRAKGHHETARSSKPSGAAVANPVETPQPAQPVKSVRFKNKQEVTIQVKIVRVGHRADVAATASGDSKPGGSFETVRRQAQPRARA